MRAQARALKAQDIIVISDVHLDEWAAALPDQHQEKHQAFVDFLRWVREDSGTQHLVINGDLLDIPQKDGTPLLPAFLDIFEAMQEICKSGIGISYVVGNHDSALLALNLKLPSLPLTIDYPFLVMQSADKRFVIEHGHLLDTWLWTYVEHQFAMLCPVEPPEPSVAMQRFLTPVADATNLDLLPSSHTFANLFPASLQWEPGGLKFTDDEIRLGMTLMAPGLLDDFADVRSDDEDFPEQAQAIAELKSLGIAPQQLLVASEVPPEAFTAFSTVGSAYYAAIPWRRAARHRLHQLSSELHMSIDAILLGHIHKTDHTRWQDNGRCFEYCNDGCWRFEHADFLHIQNGEAHVHERKWSDPLP